MSPSTVASALARPAAARSVARAEWAVDLRGAGQVGGAFLSLCRDSGRAVAAVHRRSGVERFAGPHGQSILVDATPPAFTGPASEAWVQTLEQTLRGGTPVVTCNKAPLAVAWDRLRSAAHDGDVPLVATGTVGGGTPILPALRGLDADRRIHRVEATLSGTLGVVVPLVHAGASLPDAVAEAQRLGFCEPDPSIDLQGTDAWAKACILHNSLWPDQEPVQLRDRPGPLRLDEHEIRGLRVPAVVATLAPGHVELGLQDWPHAAASGIHVRAEAAGGFVTLSGPGAGPLATARVLLADVEAVAHGQLGPGIH